MNRGSTPTCIFDVDMDLREATKVLVTFKQCDTIVIEKDLPDVTVTETQVQVKLTQAETLKLDDKKRVLMQIRAKFANGDTFPSNVMETTVEELLRDGEI